MTTNLPTIHRSAVAARIARLLQRGSTNAAALSYAFNQIFEGQENESTVARVETTGGMGTVYNAAVALYRDGNVVVVSSGLRAFFAQTFIGGYGNYTTISSDAYGFNSASFYDARTYLHQFVRRATLEPAGFYLYGFSAGGVLVEAYAKYLRTIAIRNVREIVTYGAPKPAGQGDIVEGTRINRIRWMNVGDPVPAIPYAGVTGTLSIALSLSGRNYRPDLFAHGSGGLFIDRVGAIQEAFDTRDYPPQDTEAVGLWLAGQDDGQTYPHAIEQYERRIGLLETHMIERRAVIHPAAPGNVMPPVFFAPQAAPIVNGPQDGPIVVIRPGRVTLPNGSRSSASASFGGDVMGLPTVSPGLRIRYQRSGTVWMVLYDDVVIANCRNASTAKSVASSFNRSLRLLGKTSSVSASGLIAYIQLFLGAAQQNGGGVAPPINVQ
jgi:hypothetical protein